MDDHRQVILELVEQGNYDQAIQQLRAVQSAQDSLKASTYEIGGVYEVTTAAVNNFATAELNAILKAEAARQRGNVAADAWAAKQSADIGSVIADMHAHEMASDALTATELRNYTAVAAASDRKVEAIGRAADASQRASQGMSRSLLEFSRGIEDLTTV